MSAPGTLAGSVPAAVVWLIVAAIVPSSPARTLVTAALVLGGCAVGVWSAGVEAHRRRARDPGAIVIDEVAGQWLTYLLPLLWIQPGGALELAAFAAAGFFLFRVLDVMKPWPIRHLERLPGGIGIVADDLAAGAEAGAVLAIALVWLV